MTGMNGTSEIVLDLSRLLSRVLHPTPTGVDRVEMAYAEMLLDKVPDRLRFAAVHPSGLYGRLPRQAVEHFLAQTQRMWDDRPDGSTRARAGADLLRDLWAMRPRRVPPPGPRRRVYLLASPHHLQDEPRIGAILRRERARFVCLLHDLIPIEFPEYARPGGNLLHLRRIHTVAHLASGVVANSEATRLAFLPFLRETGRDVATTVAHLGLPIPLAPLAPAPAPDRPYFVCLGTIEPRKNHLLLLNLWRAMAERHGAENVPELLVIGRRGWENEQIVDMLERCPALTGCVRELNGLSDKRIRPLLAGASAVLLPSFAEGFGMPVTEALGMGIPVLCSDIPALREVGGDVPEFLDPLDGPAWRDAILAYAAPSSPRRAAQIDRMRSWAAPTWSAHIDTVLAMTDALPA